MISSFRSGKEERRLEIQEERRDRGAAPKNFGCRKKEPMIRRKQKKQRRGRLKSALLRGNEAWKKKGGGLAVRVGKGCQEDR